MLPSIMDVAIEHGLEMNAHSTRSTKDVRFKCPFCQADEQRKDKYYFSINTKDNVFKCWSCGESGGVLKLIAMLDHISLEEVKRKLWGAKRNPHKQLHPAERLTPAQLKAIGFIGLNWGKLKQGDTTYYKRTLHWVWSEWMEYVDLTKRSAYMRVFVASTKEEITTAVHNCAAEINANVEDLLLEFTAAKFSKNKPQWAKSAEEWIALADPKQASLRPDPKPAGRERMEKVSC